MEKAFAAVKDVLTECVDESAPKRQCRARNAKLSTWTPEIRSAITDKKKALHVSVADKPQDEGNRFSSRRDWQHKFCVSICRISRRSWTLRVKIQPYFID